MAGQAKRTSYRNNLISITAFLSSVLLGFLVVQFGINVIQVGNFVQIVVQGLSTAVSLLVVVVSIDLSMENLRNARLMARNERRIKYLEEQIEFYSRLPKKYH